MTGLVPEAQAAATRAVEALAAEGDLAHLMECRVLLARARLAGRDYRGAVDEASLAAAGFDSASRPAWAALARYVGVQAEILEIEDQASVPRTLLPRCRQIAAELEVQGWAVESVHVHTFAGRLALAFGLADVARQELTQAVTARTVGAADLRAQAWHFAAALLRLADGNRAGAKRAFSAGMAVVDNYRASLGATELRAHAASHGTDLARLGMRLALDDRRAVDVLRWAERWRAGALQRPPVRPPDDERLAAHLTELRRTHSELREAADADAVEHWAVTGGDGDGAGRSGWAAGEQPCSVACPARSLAYARPASWSWSSLVRARDPAGDSGNDTVQTGRVDITRLRAALGHRWLAEFVSLAGELYAVTVTRDRVRLHRLGPVPVEQEAVPALRHPASPDGTVTARSLPGSGRHRGPPRRDARRPPAPPAGHTPRRRPHGDTSRRSAPGRRCSSLARRCRPPWPRAPPCGWATPRRAGAGPPMPVRAGGDPGAGARAGAGAGAGEVPVPAPVAVRPPRRRPRCRCR